MDSSYSGFTPEPIETIHNDFTELTLLRETEVHRLFRAKRFGRWYLLKTLQPTFLNEVTYRHMLHKEMEILMQLQHPGIVDCLGMENVTIPEEGGGFPAIVMEYIDGTTLHEWIDTEAANARSDEAMRIVMETLRALRYMHAQGIVHRDLKPSNILLTRSGHTVKLIDFSLSDADSYAILKQPSGTERYISPEQATQPIPDVRNDIYSLGIIMQQMPLPRVMRPVVSRCLRPIGQRYADVTELEQDILRRSRRAVHLRWGALIAAAAILLSLPGIVSYCRFERQQQALIDEQNRLPNAIRKAVEQMDAQIQATGLSAHIDTLTRWCWLDTAFNSKVLSANAFAYDYALDTLMGFSDEEQTQILTAMLDRWQAWHDSIVPQVRKMYEKEKSSL